MFEKQKDGDSHSEEPVEIPEDIQEEFHRKKNQKKIEESDSQIKTLLEFSNEQIKRLQVELKAVKDQLPESEELEKIDENSEEKED